MKFELIYRASLYVMLFLATLIVTIDSAATIGLPSLAYSAIVAGAGALALVTVDSNRRRGLPRWIAEYVLGIGSIYVAWVEYRSDPDQLIHALAHLLIYLILIKMFLPGKTARDDWTFFLLGLVLVLIGGWISPSESLGVFLLLWALASLWALGLFHLDREARRFRRSGPGPEFRPLTASEVDEEPYPGLIDRSFVVSALRVAATTLALGGAIFLVMPRWGRGTANGAQVGSNARHVTGFADRVALGQIGEMLENDSVVMSVETYDQEGARVQPGEETLWRGVTLENYWEKRWSRSAIDQTKKMEVIADAPPSGQRLRQVVKLEANLGDVLFSIRPILMARSVSGGEIEMSVYDGTLFRPEIREPPGGIPGQLLAAARAYEYEVLSVVNAGEEIQPFERNPTSRRRLLDMPEAIRPRIEAIARPIVEAIPEEERTPQAIAKALIEELRDSGHYSYSLKMARTNPSLDPIVDFLENHKSGHCEYFASALALLLRSQKIPARLVNGFKGGDWNPLGGIVVVRQKHAHSWVEALVSQPDDERPNWLTCDPTPSQDRDASVASVGSGGRLRTVNDYLRYIWTFYIVGYSRDRQQRLVYGPARDIFNEAMRGFRVMGLAIVDVFSWLVRFRDLRALFSVKGFFVSTLAMVALALLGRLALVLALPPQGSIRQGRPGRCHGRLGRGLLRSADPASLPGRLGADRLGDPSRIRPTRLGLPRRSILGRRRGRRRPPADR